MTEQSEPEWILLVDDNATNLQVLSQTLAGRGYELLVARNGETALSIACKAHPDLVLLDIMMPGIDGFEVCRQLKEDPATREANVIFLSALDEISDKVRGLDLGAVDYIAKPFQLEEVIARVNSHLTNHRLRKKLEAANTRMQSDLEAAARVQRSLLPTSLPETELAKFAWGYWPCDQLGGDSLNVFQVDDRYIGMYVLDVSGHGVKSALLSVAVTHALSPRVDRSSMVTKHVDEPSDDRIISPSEVAHQLNQAFPFDTDTGQFFTLLYGVLDTTARRFRFVSAGHPGPIHSRPTGFVETLMARGVASSGSSKKQRLMNL